ncbi:MAG TPA: S41 family peptidase [Gemmatimonadaceae bacterium]|nr:S41 family peptidase [Gemmatimonadaceae bacterium]
MRKFVSTLVFTVAVLALGARTASAQDHAKFLRYAGVANDGTIAFTYHDDIWVANPDGSNPRRLTANIARDFQPRFSPDGKMIAFTSDRNGNNDVFVVPVTGGEPRQLTYMTGNDEAVSWTPDGKGVVFSTSRGAMQWGSPLYVVPLDGTIPKSLGMDMGRTGMIKQDATMVAFNRSLPTYWRKGYRGNGGADIAIEDLKTGQIKEVTDTVLKNHRQNAHDVHPMWGADGKVYFASERDGFFNIWRMNADGSQQTQVTHHKDDGVQFPSVSPDGKHMVYENNFELWTLDVPNGQPKQLTIRIDADPKEGDITVLTANARADGFWPSPDGDYVAVDAHGEIFIVPTEQGVGEMRQVTSSAWRDDGEVWSPTGKYLAYTSDESREEEVWVYEMATGTKRKVSNYEAPKTNLTWAPNGTTLLYTANNRLFEVDVTKPVAPREIAYNQAGGYSNISYTADGKQLVYTRSNDDQISEIYLYDPATKREINLTHSPIPSADPPGGGGGGGGGRGGGTGLLTPDGTTLVFTSNRTGVNQLYTVSLAKLTEDQNDPLVRERKAREAAARGGRGGGGGRGGAGGGGGADPNADLTVPPLTIKVDEAGIDRRAVQLTTGANAVGQVFLSNDGRTIYYTMGGGGGAAGGGGRGRGRGAAPAAPAADEGTAGLYSIGIDGQGGRRVASGTFTGIRPTPDRRNIFFQRAAAAAPAGGGGRGRGGGGNNSEIGTFEIAKFAMATPTRIDQVRFSFPVRVDRREEWQQVLLECYRVMKYQFYDPAMHAQLGARMPWKDALAKYEPLLAYARTNQDVQDIANEMIGELNASHTGVSLPPTRSMPSIASTKYLGFELDEGTGGRYKITHVYRDGPADKEWLDLHDGDYVLAIDGKDIKNGDNYWKILTETLNTYIPVKVAKTATGEGARTVRIAAVNSLNEIKYQEWVNNNRDEVEKATNGEVAYVHIRAMDQPSLAQFEREIDRYWDKKGIIVDIRFNGGGNIDQELIDILERKPYEYWNNRSGSPLWGRRPRQLIAGPKVMMTNARSASDSEVTPQAFKDLQLGHVVGNPTSAQVIATGSFNLMIQGGTIRTPGSKVMTYSEDAPNHYGFNLENYGVEPDVWVKNGPMDNLAKNDKELKAAIAEVQKMRKDKPKVTSNN